MEKEGSVNDGHWPLGLSLDSHTDTHADTDTHNRHGRGEGRQKVASGNTRKAREKREWTLIK